jgi:uncharacterized protein (TIGR02099 family)
VVVFRLSLIWLKRCTLFLLVLIALIYLASKIVMTRLPGNKQAIEDWLAQLMHHPVQISEVHAQWQGWHPIIHFKNLALLSADRQHTVLHLGSLDIGVSVLDSLWHRQLLPREIVIDQAKLAIEEDAEGHLHIVGINQQTDAAESMNVDNIIVWLLGAGDKSLSNLAIAWHGADGSVVPLDKITILLSNQGAYHILKIVVASRELKQNSQLSLKATIKSLGNDSRELHGKVNLVMAGFGDFNGDISLKYPQDSPVLIDLHSAFTIKAANNITYYLPQKFMDPRLYDWLSTAFKQGQLTQGQLNLSGPLSAFPFDNDEGKFNVVAKIKAMQLHYNSDWPDIYNLDGQLKIDNRQLVVLTKSGQLGQCHIMHARAVIEDLASPYLTVDGQTQSDMADTVAVISHSPLAETLGKEINNLELGGPITLDLHLGTGFALDRPPLQISGDIHLQNSHVHVKDTPFVAENLKGHVTFTEDQIHAKQVLGEFFGHPLNMKINTLTDKHKLSRTEVLLEGFIEPRQIELRTHWPITSIATGLAPFKGRLLLHRKSDDAPDDIQISTNLQGIALNLPSPLAKKAAAAQALTSHIVFNRQGSHRINVSMGEVLWLQSDFHFSPQFALKGGALQLGAQANAATYDSGQLIIKGHWPSFDVANWQPYFAAIKSWQQKSQDTRKQYYTLQALTAKKTQVSKVGRPVQAINLLPIVDVMFDEFKVLGQSINNAHFKLSTTNGEQMLKLQSSSIVGRVNIPKDFPQQALQINIRKLHLQSFNAKNTKWNPKDLPPMNININNFMLDKLNLGRFELSLTPEIDGLHINNLYSNSESMQLTATGTWKNFKHFQEALLTGSMTTPNVGAILGKFGVTDNVVGGAGRANFTLAWFDSLLPSGLTDLNGRVHVDFNKGRIKNLNQQTQNRLGFASLLNLLSLQSIPRRLMLDFSDFNQGGYEFDHLLGDFIFKEGNASTRNFKLTGSVASVQLEGRIGLKKKDYHLRLAITPHVTESLPVVATLAGGPVAGVVTWVAQKALTKATDRVTTVIYYVTGPWDKPNIKDTSSF